MLRPSGFFASARATVALRLASALRPIAAALLLLAITASPVSGQGTIRRHDSSDNLFGIRIIALGDMTGDSIPDYGVEAQPYDPMFGPTFELRIFSGYDGTPVRTTQGVAAVSGGDFDGDGRNDIAIRGLALTDPIRIDSGATGAPLGLIPVPSGFPYFTPWILLSDLDGDGRAEVIAAADSSFTARVLVFNNNLTLRTSVTLGGATGSPNSRGAVVADLDQDGWRDVAFTVGSNIVIMSSTTGSVLRTYSFGTPVFAVISDLDFDGREDLAGLGNPLRAISLTSGTTLWTSAAPPPGWSGFRDLAPAGDMNGDGKADLVASLDGLGAYQLPGNRLLAGVSGANGDVLLAFRGDSAAFAESIAAIGDLDFDGISEIAQGAIILGGTNRVSLHSPRGAPGTYAHAVIFPPGCTTAPFFAHSAPPTLGTTVSHDLLGGPANTAGIVAIHAGPRNPLPIAAGCLVFPDVTRFNEWFILPLMTDFWGDFSFSATIPNDPAFLGIDFTLQVGLATPNGVTLSTGSVARIGY